ncbi:16S rRNA (uracil(1498)-N(3))-methyltransferase [Paenibacillus thalictri]|uniref:Ribosomal RNA small subunit methyltransferase E n=1 Tax=Paenibacillus thalictri TaxID=2527873 RepID=A0A4Q9DF23_9BACL|nr:16S rRNA (uracil(1498)-N(3))-methyltransferase [Paenibacillus thalictri]TBL70408.1 16S rRNA (uracil(1498)-N(3))-methyltransferase [Paenibacillus thalictri]
MQRYFIEAGQFHEDHVVITGDDAHHLLRVMRAKEGDRVIVSDGEQREALVEISGLEKDQATCRIVELLPMDREPAVEVWIAQSLPKGDKMETVIQKGTEVGAARFLPFTSERTIVQLDAKKEEKRTVRWQKIAKEAAEQAHRSRVPVVAQACGWNELLQAAKQMDAAWICYEKESGSQLKPALRKLYSRPDGSGSLKIMLIIGPEGGFTEQEVARAETAGCLPVSLGKRILRTETAAIVGLTCILYEAGEMGGV